MSRDSFEGALAYKVQSMWINIPILNEVTDYNRKEHESIIFMKKNTNMNICLKARH